MTKDKQTLGLFDSRVPYAKSSDTSKEAAGRIRHVAGSLEAKVLAEIVRLGSATCDEIEIALDMPHQTASARVNSLMERKLIVNSGEKRLTRSKRRATVWVAAQ